MESCGTCLFIKKLFRLYNVPKIHSFCCIWQYFFPDTEKYFACTCHILFIHSSKPNSIPPLHDCKYCCCKYCCYKYWCTNTWDPAFNSFDIYQEMGLLDHKVILFLIFKGNSILFSQWLDQMFKLVLEKATRDQMANICWITEKAREFQKNIYFCFIDDAKAFDSVDHNKLWKILKEMGIPDHLTHLLRNLYAGQEATVRTGHGTDWFQIGKGVRQGCILSPCLFNLYAEYIMRNAGLE